MRILGNDRSGTRFFTCSVNVVGQSSVQPDFNARSGESPGRDTILTNAHCSANAAVEDRHLERQLHFGIAAAHPGSPKKLVRRVRATAYRKKQPPVAVFLTPEG